METKAPLRERLHIVTDSTHEQYHGQRFYIVRSLTKVEADIDEVGPMFEVKTESGDRISVFQDEIYDFDN